MERSSRSSTSFSSGRSPPSASSIKEKGGDDKSSGMDDRVTIKSGDTRVIIERGRIAKINRPTSVSNVSAG